MSYTVTVANRFLEPAAWVDKNLGAGVNKRIVQVAIGSVGIWELPGNRGAAIDAFLHACDVPQAQPWCAAWATAVWREAGAEPPPTWRGASCDEWMKWAIATGRWSKSPECGAAVLYGVPGDASHIGIIARVEPRLCSIEGNTSLTAFSREGVAVDFKEVNIPRVLGYAHPAPFA